MRAWELAIGSLAAAAAWDAAPMQPRLARLFWPACLVLLVIPLRPIGTPHPGLDAFLVCSATLIVLVARHPVLNTGPLPRLLARVGNFSYSLYLVHWPIFAFLNNVYLGEQPRSLRLMAALLALGLGYALYRSVEVPVRRSALGPSGRLLGATVAATVVVLAIPVAGGRLLSRGIDYAKLRRPNFGLGRACDFDGRFEPRPACSSGPAPRILVWGDSFAMQLVAGITSVSDAGPASDPKHLRTHSGFHRHLGRRSRISGGVVPEMPAVQPLGVRRAGADSGDRDGGALGRAGEIHRTDRGNRMALGSAGGRLAARSRRLSRRHRPGHGRTAAAIRALGKRVIVVAPLPSSGFDTGICLERKATGRPVFGVDSACRVSARGYREGHKRLFSLLDSLGSAGVPVFDFGDVLCGSEYCTTRMDGVLLYRDGGHLSYDGSRLLAQKFRLDTLLLGRAR